MDSIAVFAYGSLVERTSAATTLGRPVDKVWAASLPGWKRRFSLARHNRTCEKTFARAVDGSVPEWVLGLNVEPAGSSQAESVNGCLIEIEPAELERLDARELRYNRVEVAEQITDVAGRREFGRVVTYVAKSRHLAPAPPPDAVILRSYANVVEAGLEALGAAHTQEYRRNTLPYPAELIDGVLVADSIPDGNPRDW